LTRLILLNYGENLTVRIKNSYNTMLLNKQEVDWRIGELGGWKIEEGKLKKIFKFKDFISAIEFVNAVAGLAEKENHHPDILITYNKVRITLWTHDVGGLSEKDFNLASKIEKGLIDL